METEKTIKNKSKNILEKNYKHSQGFSVNKIISSKGVIIDTTDEAFSGGIIIDLSR